MNIIVITPDQEQRLRQLVTVFLQENAKINLSAFRTEENCWIGNVLDSLAFLELPSPPIPPPPPGKVGPRGVRVLDVGTGGGFPLLPLAIALPHVRFTGIDSVQKKIDAIARIITTMQRITNVDLLCGRVEELARHDWENFDVVTARAVAEINVLLEYCIPFVKIGGKILLWKSLNIDAELKESMKAQKELHCEYKGNHVYELPSDFGKRQILIFEKTGPTPKLYPRPVGVAKKKPLE